MEALAQASEREFEVRLSRLLSRFIADHPEHIAGPAPSADVVEQSVVTELENATTLGFEWEDDCAVYAAIFVVGPLLRAPQSSAVTDRLAWMRPYLERPETSAQAKIALIERRLLQRAESDEYDQRLVELLDFVQTPFA